MSKLRFAMPSSGALYQVATDFMNACGLTIHRPSERRYVCSIPSLLGIEVLFQRQTDITSKVDEGSADAGLTGLDTYHEYRIENGNTVVILPNTGLGKANLVIAVPTSWIDVVTIDDLADLALDFHNRGRTLRIATKYSRLLNRFLQRKGIYYYTLIKVRGVLEAAPAMGYTDIIADISATGGTLMENGLRVLEGGTIFKSEVALIANAVTIAPSNQKLALLREIVERMEATLTAKLYVRLSASVPGKSAQDVTGLVLKAGEIGGINGPVVVPSPKDSAHHQIQAIIPRARMMEAVDFYRTLGGDAITIEDSGYLFRGQSALFANFLNALQLIVERNKGN